MGEIRIPGAFKGQQAHLRTVSVRDDEVMVTGERGECFDGRNDVLLLEFSDWGLASF
jgi:hypothetical protein